MSDQSQIKINSQFFIVSFLIFMINVVLELYYLFFLSDNFNYLGFKLDFDFFKFIEIKLLLFLFLVLSWYLYSTSKFLYSIFILLLLFFFIPNSIMFAYMNSIRGPIYSIALFLIVFIFISPFKLAVKTIYTDKYLKSILILSIALLFLAPIFILFKFNINLNTLLLKEIYETREQFGSKINSFYSYFYNWEVKIIIPVMLAFFLIARKYLLALFTFTILIYLFVISGNKAVYMTSLVTLFFYFAGGENYVSKIKLFLLFLLLILIVLPLIDIYILDSFLLRGTFVMRMFFFPALLNYCYFDFFANTPLYFSENHFFNLIFHSPFDINSAYIISKVYFHADDMYANNGIISDGYMNLGYWGVLILSTLFALIFMFFNSIKVDTRYFGIFFILVFFFLSAPMFTILITGGVWLLFIFAITMMKSKS